MHGRENKLINNEIEKVYGRPRCRKTKYLGTIVTRDNLIEEEIKENCSW